LSRADACTASKEQWRALYFASEVASEPEVTNWVSEDVTSLISRMTDLLE
jgi:hypothetical protein